MLAILDGADYSDLLNRGFSLRTYYTVFPSTSRKISCVCSPSIGGALRYVTGEAENRSGLAVTGAVPPNG